MLKTLTLAAVMVGTATLADITLAQAQTLSPIQAETIDLGSTRGSAFYVPESDGYHLVATLFSGGANTPVRFNAVLGDGQSASVSIPGPTGTLAHEVTFSRAADHLVVRETPESQAATQ